MKLNENFVLRQVAGNWVAIPLGQAALDFTGILSLNDSGAMLWNVLAAGGGREELVNKLTEEYAISREIAAADADEFITKLMNAGCMEG